MFFRVKVISTLIRVDLKPEAPVLVSKGEVIADGVDSELDELRDLLRSGRDHLDKMLRRKRAYSNPLLKIAYNNVFGYYIEVRNTHEDKVQRTGSENKPWSVQNVISLRS